MPQKVLIIDDSKPIHALLRARLTDEPIELSAFELLFKSLGVAGALTGPPAAGDATLRFSALSGSGACMK